jgi:two-component system, cell cycle sensor histidine kinase and response regulator CckA
MKPNTAVAFLCAGIALVLLARPYDSSRFRAGRGARFKIYWPRTAQSGYPAQAVHSPSGLPGGSETILLVEDDDAMRELTCKCLAAVGYNVLTAQDGEVAIRVCSRHDGPIHLLLTDVVMPGISGRQLSNSLAALRPELKVLYMSGYTADLIADHGVLESNMALLEKPFTQELLLNKLRSVLDCSLAAGMAGAG